VDPEREGGRDPLNVSFKGTVVKSTDLSGAWRCLGRSCADAEALGGEDEKFEGGYCPYRSWVWPS
jgi:hypothetical protein